MFRQEILRKKIKTTQLNFINCDNKKCNSIYLTDVQEVYNESEHFCPNCKEEVLQSHIVQCEHCQTVVNIIPISLNQNPVMFFVKKCSTCSGTTIEEKRLRKNNYPNLFV